ncbi:hypothetical protein HDF17_000600 [Granulicella arctica]|uniref:Uncharacterized protein n=1 Tax=Granulicella arctica TaxID=940613 RepID=A0A7Y9TRL3_9BACT|nr:hypothetical protein [Granulicella arctica]
MIYHIAMDSTSAICIGLKYIHLPLHCLSRGYFLLNRDLFALLLVMEYHGQILGLFMGRFTKRSFCLYIIGVGSLPPRGSLEIWKTTSREYGFHAAKRSF